MEQLISLRYCLHYICYVNTQSSGSKGTVSVTGHRVRYIYVDTVYLSLYDVILLIC